MPLTDSSIHPLHAHILAADGGGGGGWNMHQNFKKGDLIKTQILGGGWWE